MACCVSFSWACCSSMGKRSLLEGLWFPWSFSSEPVMFVPGGKYWLDVSHMDKRLWWLFGWITALSCAGAGSVESARWRWPPSTFPQAGVRLLARTWGSTFSVDDTQFKSYMGASFQLWWIRSCPRAVRLGDELLLPKLGGDCSLGLWTGHCEGRVAAVGMDQGLGMTDLVLRCPGDLWWVGSRVPE